MTGTPLTENSLMLFGKYQGFELKNIPARYLLWIYDNLKLREDLAKYIELRKRNFEAEVKAANQDKRR